VPRTFSLGNSGQVAFNFTTAFAKGTQYMVQPSSGFVLPGHQLELTVVSAAIPQVSDITDNLYGDTLTITTDIKGDAPRDLAITQTAQGAILELEGTLQFPTLTPSETASASVTIKNVGNASATHIELSGAASFSIAPNAIAELGPGEETSPSVTFHSLDRASFEAPIAISHAEGLCAPLPAPSVASGSTTFLDSSPVAITLVTPTPRTGEGALFVRLANGTVASLGENNAGVLGTGTLVDTAGSPALVRTDDNQPLDGVVSVSGGRSGACARRNDSTVWCWGNRFMRRQPDAVTASPYAQLETSAAQALSMTYSVRCTSASVDGAVSCSAGERGYMPFTPPEGVTGAQALALQPYGGYAINSDGTVTSFGSNLAGERGNGETSADITPPSLVTGLDDVLEVVGTFGKLKSRDRLGACARKSDGTVWCWGYGRHGRLGNGDSASSTVPVQVMIDATTPLTGVTSIAGSHGHRCATTPTNVYCWGRGGNGRLGRSDDDTNQSGANPWARPTTPAITDGISITTVQRGACVLRSIGRIVCFGDTPFSDGPQVSIDDFAAQP
jgi:hypothetical protein